MPLHGRVSAGKFRVMNGLWPYGHGGAPPSTPPPGDFQSPGPPLSGSYGPPPLMGIETPLWPFCLAWRRRAPFLLAPDPFIGAWHGPCGTMAGNPGGLVGPPPPLRHQPRPPGCPFLDLPQAPYEGLYVVRALFLPGLRGFGRRRRGGGETRLRPALSRTWISPDRPYPPGPGRRPPAYPSGRPANSQIGSQIGTPSQIGAPGPGEGPRER